MNEKIKNATTTDGTGAHRCERSEQLVAYLYDEASPEESASFRQHLNSCRTCRDELSAFGNVRELVGTWHADVLSAAPTLDVDELLAPAGLLRPAAARERSALAAVREFFTLSPLWLRAGAVAAMLFVCGLAAVTVARTEVRWNSDGLVVQSGIPERIVVRNAEVPSPNGYTKEQVAEMVNREIEIARKNWELEREQNEGELTVAGSRSQTASRAGGISQKSSPLKNRKRNIQPQTQQDRQVLAKNFRYDEDDLPRLSDLLGGVY